MGCTPAPTCRRALTEATQRWPGRDKSGDGICASDAHNQQNPTSDHAIGNAFDVTNSPPLFVSKDYADWMRLEMLAGRGPRMPDGRPVIKYIISTRRIFNPAISPEWRPYNGQNAHLHHAHFSIFAYARDWQGSWFAGYQQTQPGGFLMALTDAEQAEVLKKVRDTDARTGNIQNVAAKLDNLLPNLAAAIAHELASTGTGGGPSEAQIEAACTRAVAKIRLTTTVA